DFLFEGIVVLLFEERHGIVVLVEVDVVVDVDFRRAGRSGAGFGGFAVVVVVGHQRFIDSFVDFGGDGFGLFVLVVRRARLDLVFGFLVGLVVGRGRTGADAAELHRFFRIEVRAALGTVRRTLVEVVELGLAGR